MYVYVPCEFLVPTEVKTDCQIPLELELQMFGSYHVAA